LFQYDVVSGCRLTTLFLGSIIKLDQIYSMPRKKHPKQLADTLKQMAGEPRLVAHTLGAKYFVPFLIKGMTKTKSVDVVSSVLPVYGAPQEMWVTTQD